MTGIAGSSYALFAIVWGGMCLLAGALVTDALLRGVQPPRRAEDGAAEV